MDSREINDDYEHLDENLEYILENVLSEKVQMNANTSDDCYKLKELFNTLLLNNCDCNKASQQQCFECFHGGNYIFDKDYQELVLNPAQSVQNLMYECTQLCKCKPEKCLNRLVQRGPRKFLKIIDSPKYKSKGLITTRDIPKGAFICEYAGELLTRQDAQNVLKQNDEKHRMNYVLFLKESCQFDAIEKIDDKVILTIVDPSKKGNIGRYLNHSCAPNCKTFSVRIDCPIPKIAIFSNRFIKAGEELCFLYNEGVVNKKTTIDSRCNGIACLCGSDNCMKYLPNTDFLSEY